MREKTKKIAEVSINIDKKIYDEYHYLMECGWKQSEMTTELLKDIFLEIQYVDLYVQLEALKLIINTWENSKKIVKVVARANIVGTKDASNFVGYLNDTIVPVLQTVVIEISRLTDKEGQKEKENGN